MLLAVMCASGGGARPAEVAAAEVTVRLRSPLFFGSGREAPASFEVDVTNQATVPLVVRSIRIASPGMVQYTILPRERIFKETIAPGETKTLPVDATAVASRGGLMAGEPLNVRVDVEFEASGRRFREIYSLLNVVR
jgi:hypothetical protein